MKLNILSFLVIVGLQVNCARTIRVYDSPSLTYEKLNAKFTGKTVEILSFAGTTFFGKKIRIEQDSTFWSDVRSDDITSVATSEIDRITLVSGQAVEGMMLGFTIGFASGAAIGSLAGEDCSVDRGEICFDKEETAVLLGVVLSIPAAIIGGISGAFTKRPNHYVLHKNPGVN